MLFALSVLLASPAGAEALKVKAGLWETTTSSEKSAANRPTNLNQLSPEQRAKVERKLAEQVKRETRRVQSCLNQAQIDSGEAFTGSSHHGACKRQFEKQTASEQVANINCDGINPMSGKVEMHAQSPEQMTGTIELIYGARGQMQLQSLSSVTARWLGGDCSKMAHNIQAAHSGHPPVK